MEKKSNIFNLKIGLLGFFVSWQYGSCYSWVAQKGDISGRPASIFFIGYYFEIVENYSL